MQEGHQWLKKTFQDSALQFEGANKFKLPHIGWHLDAFGHSGVTVELLNEMGLDALVFARLSEDQIQDLNSNNSR